jgi:hypothetical protein
MSVYLLRQNKSGGVYTLPAENILVEAPSAEEARAYAVETWGIRFNNPDDCECCGFRWPDYGPDGEELGWNLFQSLDDAVKGLESLKYRYVPGRTWDGRFLPFYVSGKAQGK